VAGRLSPDRVSRPLRLRLRRGTPRLVSHDQLDWAPLGRDESAMFLNLMTARLEPLDSEFVDLTIRQIQGGEWPWSFFCYPEERPRPVFPSFFRLLAPSAPDG